MKMPSHKTHGDASEALLPIAMKTTTAAGSIVTLVVTPVRDSYTLESTPRETLGVTETHRTLADAITRMLACAEAIRNDEHLPPRAPLVEGRIIAPEALEALPVGSVIEDRFRDHGERLENGSWLYPDTRPLSTPYVAKHFPPFTLVRVGGQVSVPNAH